jgi:hypothetical protein
MGAIEMKRPEQNAQTAKAITVEDVLSEIDPAEAAQWRALGRAFQTSNEIGKAVDPSDQ